MIDLETESGTYNQKQKEPKDHHEEVRQGVICSTEFYISVVNGSIESLNEDL